MPKTRHFCPELIDHTIQYETEKILKSAIEKYQADRGTIIVMGNKYWENPASASYPNFNPNDYASVDIWKVSAIWR